MSEMNFEVLRELHTIRENDNGDKLEVNKVSWYGREPKVDIRYWKYEDGVRVKPAKGLTLTDKEYEDFVKFFKEL